jgi:biopolymer transport protein ExbB
MFAYFPRKRIAVVRLGLCLAAGITAAMLMWSLPAGSLARGQDDQAASEPAGPSGEPAPTTAHQAKSAPEAAAPASKSINIFELAIAGGIFMIPIAGMSVLAVTMTIERLLGLRKPRLLPSGLVEGLGQLAAASGNFDPRKAYRLCQQFPSAAANVIRAMLVRVGRPIAEVESAVAQASQREADKLYSNVRWLNLTASLSTMLGLIGTIQGMIMAFHRLTTMDAAADRTSVLADGIYTALVTTFAGLAVAIPALLASHFFENRILSSFRQIDELTFNLLPQLERYEGRVRFSRHADNGDGPLEDESGRIEAGAT